MPQKRKRIQGRKDKAMPATKPAKNPIPNKK